MSTLLWVIILASGAIAAVIGLLSAQSVHTTKINESKGIQTDMSSPVPSQRTATPDNGIVPRDIVPSPVIDPHPVFFFGTADGSSGYYAARPNK